MGCDGGTIPKRDELVKTKKRPEQKDKTADLAFKWRNCAISQEALVQPIMACELGKLYNKEAVLEFLLDRSKFECAESFKHLRGLKDVKELVLTENPAAKNSKSAEKGGGYIDMQVADYICPTGVVEMNGIYKFCFLWTCGCVVSDRALKEIKTQNCHKCGKPFTEKDIVTLNATDDDATQNQYNMDNRKMMAKLAKKAKKEGKRNATETVTSSGASGESVSKKLCSEPSASTSSSTGTTKLTSSVPTQRVTFANGSVSHQSKLASHNRPDSKSTKGDHRDGGKAIKDAGEKRDVKKSIQEDPNASAVFKSLFNTCEQAKRQTKSHWVTYNPQYF